ncbi:MAG: SPOR domain-containing protein [Bacteroidales bacterium]|nr:SPOR domain-containing protein [Bacteroidales bacterium]
METIQAIQRLLFLEDCLIIPGLGGFVSRYRSAVIDQATGTFTPPAKEIVFNGELVQNDGVLVDYLSDKNGVSADIARSQVDLFVQETIGKLENGDPVFIEGVGQFILGRDSLIRFQTDPGTNLFLEAFGLASFRLHEVVHENHTGFGVAPAVRAGDSPRTIEFAVDQKPRTFHHHNLRRIAIAMPLLIAFSLLPFNSRISDTLISSHAGMTPEPSLFHLNYPDPIPTDTSRLIVYPITDSLAAGPLSADSVAVEPVISEKTVVAPVAEAVKAEVPKAVGGKYPVIAGCFKMKENAERLYKRLVDKGYPAKMTPMRNGQMYKVTVQTFATRREAISGLARLKDAEPDLELWASL